MSQNAPTRPETPANSPPHAQATPTIVINNINNNTATAGGFPYLPKSKIVALILCFFLGGLGIHRFYVGKVGTGILYIFTLGFFGIGVLLDFILILVGSFRDKAGYPLR